MKNILVLMFLVNTTLLVFPAKKHLSVKRRGFIDRCIKAKRKHYETKKFLYNAYMLEKYLRVECFELFKSNTKYKLGGI